MVVQALPDTPHVTVNYEDSRPDAERRARALHQTCESDLLKLERYFHVKGLFEAPAKRLSVTVSTGSFASNNGYDGTIAHGQSTITIDAFSGATDPDLADDIVRMLFVAEAAETIMGFLNVLVQRWHPSWSDGEGLSRVMAAEFYPRAFYGSIVKGPFVNAWLQDPTRPDWVTNNEHSDGKPGSYACATLFINYLRYQLGYDWDKICPRAGPSLAETYAILTGKNDGWTSFAQLLGKHFPPGKTTLIGTDNPFPLWDSQYRSVSIDLVQEVVGLPRPDRSGSVEVSPFIGCPAGKYGFTIFDQTIRLHCTAQTYGFGQPKFSWKVNGAPVAGPNGTVVAPQASVGTDIPNAWHSENVLLNYWTSDVSTYRGPAGELALSNMQSPGHLAFTVSVGVSEADDPAVASAARLAVLDAQNLVYEPAFYRDQETCQAAFRERVGRLVKRTELLNLLLTLPDPPHDLVEGVRNLGEIVGELGELERDDPEAAREIAAVVANQLHVQPENLLPER